MRALLIGIVSLLLGAELCAEPIAQWSHAASGVLTASPAVADISDSPGLETIVAGASGIRCLNAQGGLLWESTENLSGTLFLSPAVSAPLPSGRRAIAALTTQGLLVTLDGGSGRELWRHALETPCNGLLWCELNDDKTEDLVLNTKEKGLLAFSGDGSSLWAFGEQELGHAPQFSGPAAVADVDENRRQEILVVDKQGPLCLDANGKTLWQTQDGGPFEGLIAVVPPGEDGIPKLYCFAGTTLMAFDAGVGDLLWKCPLEGLSCPVSLALGDLDRDDVPDVVAGGGRGEVMAVGSNGKPLWKSCIGKEVPVHLSLGDVDVDTMLEVFAAAEDGAVYMLDAAGEPKGKLQGDSPIKSAVILADTCADNVTHILYADSTLHCASYESRFVPELTPWPMDGVTPARTYALPPKSSQSLSLNEETRPLLPQGGLDEGDGNLPRGWKLERGAAEGCSVDTQTRLTGTGSLCVKPAPEAVVITSSDLKLEAEVQSINAVVMFKGAEGARAAIRWMGAHGPIREDELQARPAGSDGWKRFNLNDTRAPLGARAVVMVLSSPAGGAEACYWDEAQVTGSVRLIPQVAIYVNQVGYETNAPKLFTVWSNFKASSARFAVRSGEQEHAGVLSNPEHITGAYESPWPGYYWRGDFTTYEGMGAHSITVTLDQVTAKSVSLDIGPDVLWIRTLETAVAAFRHNRCGVEDAPCHGPCHLDDALESQSLTGGWHDGTDYGKTGTPSYTLELATAYSTVRWKLASVKDAPMDHAFLDEVLWGGQLLLHSLRPDGSALPSLISNPAYWGPAEKETDNQPNTGDERKPDPNATGDPSLHGAALARLARLQPNEPGLREGADRALQWALSHDMRGPLQFVTALNLLLATKDEKYRALTQELLPKVDPAIAESLCEYDTEFEPAISTTFELAGVISTQVDALLATAHNPFGVRGAGSSTRTNFFNTPETAEGTLQGDSERVLEAAALTAIAYRFKPLAEYKQFIYDQLNWILGCNPYGISLMEGAGKRFAPSYCQRYTAGGLARGAVPGSIPNGISGKGPGDDRPYFDMSGAEKPNAVTNACSLKNNALFIKALCNLKRIRIGNPFNK